MAHAPRTRLVLVTALAVSLIAAVAACAAPDSMARATTIPPASQRVEGTPTMPPPSNGTPAPATAPLPTPSATPAATMVVPSKAVEIDRGTTARPEVAFTFDCAAHSGPTDEILRVLREERVRVTWFMVGLWVRDHPELTRVIAREHEIANHSWAHPDYRDLTAAEIAADLDENERYMLALTGQSMKPLWRAPSGARDQRVLEAAAAAGWPLHIFWTIGHDERGTVTGDTGDWRGIPASEVWANTVRAAGLGPGLITVSHCDAPSTAAVMRDTIRLFRDRGLKIVTVSELLRP